MAKNLTWQKQDISRADREKLLNQKGALLWFTGLSGSGKSTLANEVAKNLHAQGKLCYVLDGDNVRQGLNKDLSFSAEDRTENIRRIGEIAKLFVDSGVIVITAFISPFKEGRQNSRELFADEFFEVHVDCPLEVCEQRDVKGLYAKARAGEITNFTGIHQPYETPENPEIRVNTADQKISESVEVVIAHMKNRQII